MVDNNPTLTSRFQLPADYSAVGAAVEHARNFAAQANCGPEAEARLLILVEEAVSNIIEHGAPPPGSKVGLELAAIGADIGVTITDMGQYFDPRAYPFDASAIPERGGGAGLALLHAWSTVIGYDCQDDANCLRFVIANHG
jgi:serine/threonine-protein kinase RsbW